MVLYYASINAASPPLPILFLCLTVMLNAHQTLCSNCEDYDLCEECEGVEGVHNPDHVFLKIRRPVLTAGRRKNGKMNSLLKHNLYEVDEETRR